jgi:competence protein ComEA
MDSSRKKTLAIIAAASIGLIACGVNLIVEYYSPPSVVYRTDSTEQEGQDPAASGAIPGEGTDSSGKNTQSNTASAIDVASQTEIKTIPIYICGSIALPGVYQVQLNSYLFELVELAGGLTAEAAADDINLVMCFTSPVSVYIPSIDELDESQSDTPAGDSSSYIRINSDTYVWGDPDPTSASDAAPADQSIVNINLAGKSELMTLAGVGEVTAESIIQFREQNGPFLVIEDIMKVPGIKQGRFDAIKDKITV